MKSAALLLSLLVWLPASVVAGEQPAATVAGQPISMSELENHVRPKLIEIETERYETLREGLDELVAEQLLIREAKERGVTEEVLIKTEIMEKVPAPSDAEIKKLYDDNKDQLGGQSFETVKPQIVDYLKEQKATQRQSAYIDELKKKYKTVVLLKPPVVKVDTGGRTARGGGPNAAVTIIEFSDYECPFCKRAEPTVERVMDAYGDKVRLYYRDFPLPMHQHARLASEAANCANAQGKFWEYHKTLFASDDLTKEKLQAIATEAGLDRAKFDACLEKQEFKAAIDKDIADGTAAGVSGTPAFFINGRSLSGAQPFEKFKEIIDEEIARAADTKS